MLAIYGWAWFGLGLLGLIVHGPVRSGAMVEAELAVHGHQSLNSRGDPT